jgi:hypothetical protein
MTKKDPRHHYLLLKTHNKTGLKYLCYTTKDDPFKYPGSGKRWKNHLKKHGKDIHTEILGDFKTIDELKKMGTLYSHEWDVVEDPGFANLRIEEGDGGDTSSFIDYKSMKPMPTGKWKRKDLSDYNQSRINPRIKILTCPWCGEKGKGYDWVVKHLSATYWRKPNVKNYNCDKNPNRILNYNEKLYEIDGEQLTINDIVKRFNFTKTTIYQRLQKGQSMKDVLSRPKVVAKKYLLFGQFRTAQEIVKHQEIPSTTLNRLLKKVDDLDSYFTHRNEFLNSEKLNCDKCGKWIETERSIIKHFELCQSAKKEEEES